MHKLRPEPGPKRSAPLHEVLSMRRARRALREP